MCDRNAAAAAAEDRGPTEDERERKAWLAAVVAAMEVCLSTGYFPVSHVLYPYDAQSRAKFVGALSADAQTYRFR